MVDNQDALFHVWPLGSLEDRYRSARALEIESCVTMITNAFLNLSTI